MYFESKILNDARRGVLSVDCHEMTLQQNTDDEPQIYSGSGYIKQNAGELEFKLFAAHSQNATSPAFLYDNVRAGELYAEGLLFTLTAVDLQGNTWTAARVRPDRHISFWVKPPAIVLSGTLLEIATVAEREYAIRDHFLCLAFYDDVEVPFDTSTSYLESVRNREPEFRRSERDRAEFRAAGYDFTVRAKEGVILVGAHGMNAIPEGFETRIVESLMFVLGKPLVWGDSVHIYNNIEKFKIRSSVRAISPIRLKPPILAFQDCWLRKSWVLFGLYLEFVMEHRGEGFHVCSAYLHSVSEASSCSVDTFALNLAVAVEGLVKTLYASVGKKCAAYRECIRKLRDYVLAWPALAEWNGRVGMNKGRLSSLVESLNSTSPQDRMYELAKKDYLISEHIPVWKRLRNDKAHASNDPVVDRQRLLRDIDTVTVLMYHLIFAKIGYQGFYFDYSTIGYPVRVYPPSVQQPEDGVTPDNVRSLDPSPANAQLQTQGDVGKIANPQG